MSPSLSTSNNNHSKQSISSSGSQQIIRIIQIIHEEPVKGTLHNVQSPKNQIRKPRAKILDPRAQVKTYDPEVQFQQSRSTHQDS